VASNPRGVILSSIFQIADLSGRSQTRDSTPRAASRHLRPAPAARVAGIRQRGSEPSPAPPRGTSPSPGDAQASPEASSEAHSEAHAQADVFGKAHADADVHTVSDRDANADGHLDTDRHVVTVPYGDTDADVDSTDVHSDADGRTDSRRYAIANTKRDPDSNANSAADDDSDSNGHEHPDTCTHANTATDADAKRYIGWSVRATGRLDLHRSEHRLVTLAGMGNGCWHLTARDLRCVHTRERQHQGHSE
jgi:hypothetical protein